MFESDNEYMNKYIKRVNRFTNDYPKLFDSDTGNHDILWDGTFVKDRGEGVFLKLPIEREALVQWDDSIHQMAKQRRAIMKDRDYVFDKAPPQTFGSNSTRFLALNIFLTITLTLRICLT
ncbi:hypothetical protein JCM19233_5404 [Vibrio astriarenae]|nr:hypothetical protein JCM19233_5404 [Vibrio sp. C7]